VSLPKQWITALLGAFLASGCALTDLSLRPPAERPAQARGSLGRGRLVALDLVWSDGRPQPGRCGTKKNGYNIQTADIFCQAEPASHLAYLLAQELTALGFVVVAADAGPLRPGTLRIDGELNQFFVEPHIGAFTVTPEVDVEVRLVASSGHGLLASRNFYVKAADENLAATDGTYQDVYEQALQLIVQRLVAAVIDLSDRYPDLDGPAPAVHS
jgi:hypothetical protein